MRTHFARTQQVTSRLISVEALMLGLMLAMVGCAPLRSQNAGEVAVEDPGRAAEILTDVLERNPAHPEARRLLAQTQAKRPGRQSKPRMPAPRFPEKRPNRTAATEMVADLPIPPEPAVLPNLHTGSREISLTAQVSQPAEVQPAEDAAPLTLHLDNVDVRKALELLSRQGPTNILVSSAVKGNITANLEGFTFEQALQAILTLSKLVAHRENGLIYVYTQEEYDALHKNDQKVITRIYRLSYVRGTDLEKMITPFLTASVGKISITPASEIGIKSDTGAVGGDSLAGGEVVIVQDYEHVLQTIDQIVTALDVQPVQILIEAVILEVFLENGTDLGVNFAVLDGGQNLLAIAGNAAKLNSGVGFLPSQLLTTDGQINGTSNGTVSDTHGIKFGFIDKDVTGFVHALETVGKTKILASPRLLVLNKQRAELIIGDRIGYKTLTVNQTSTVEKIEFLNVGTQLRLRPFVAQDGVIRMEIHPERSSGRVENNIPRTNTSEVTTNVMVPDGSTIVIGGLLEDEEQVSTNGIPGLCKLPYVGALFRNEVKKSVKKELVVLLTPRIWNPSCPVELPIAAQSSQQLLSTATEADLPARTSPAPRLVRRPTGTMKPAK